MNINKPFTTQRPRVLSVKVFFEVEPTGKAKLFWGLSWLLKVGVIPWFEDPDDPACAVQQLLSRWVKSVGAPAPSPWSNGPRLKLWPALGTSSQPTHRSNFIVISLFSLVMNWKNVSCTNLKPYINRALKQRWMTSITVGACTVILSSLSWYRRTLSQFNVIEHQMGMRGVYKPQTFRTAETQVSVVTFHDFDAVHPPNWGRSHTVQYHLHFQ